MGWLARIFGLDWFAQVDTDFVDLRAQNDALRGRVAMLEAWLRNIDAVVWKIEQTGIVKGEPEVPDYKALAEKIRAEMDVRKVRFPVHKEDLL